MSIVYKLDPVVYRTTSDRKLRLSEKWNKYYGACSIMIDGEERWVEPVSSVKAEVPAGTPLRHLVMVDEATGETRSVYIAD